MKKAILILLVVALLLGAAACLAEGTTEHSILNPIAGFRFTFQLPEGDWQQIRLGSEFLSGTSMWEIRLPLGEEANNEMVQVLITQRLFGIDRVEGDRNYYKGEPLKDRAGYVAQGKNYDEYVLDFDPTPENPEKYLMRVALRFYRLESEAGKQARQAAMDTILSDARAEYALDTAGLLMDDSGTMFYPATIQYGREEIALAYNFPNWGQSRNVQGVYKADGKKYTFYSQTQDNESKYDRLFAKEGSVKTEYAGNPAVEERLSSNLNVVVKTEHGVYSYRCDGADIDHETASALIQALFESAEYREAPQAWYEGPIK